MEASVGSAKLKLLQGDITEQGTDAIVNAGLSGTRYRMGFLQGMR
jgi:hypothetical protein